MGFSNISESSALSLSISRVHFVLKRPNLLLLGSNFFHSFLLWYFAGVAKRFMSVGKYRLDFTMCYLAVSSLLYFDYSLTDSTFKQPAVHVLIHEPAVLNQIYAEKHASLSFPSAFTCFFSYSTWPAIWLPRALRLRPHANLWHTRCKCGVSLYCLHGRVVVWCSGVPVWRKYWQQDSGEQIEHKVNTFHLDSNATPGLQSSAISNQVQLCCLIKQILSPCANMKTMEVMKCKADIKKKESSHL